MGSLSAIPGYDALESQRTALKAQIDTLLDQRDAAAEAFGGIASPQAQNYQQQVKALEPQYLSVIDQQQQLILNDGNGDQPSPTVTTGQSQSTPAANSRDDAYTQNPTSGGAGAGTTNNAGTSVGADDNPGASKTTAQQIINQAFGVSTNSTITTQPNVLDQYASYTYAISWYLMTPGQYNSITTGSAAPSFNTAGWSLLMQSGGAPTTGRNQYFPLDYYLDDLEIETFLVGKGTNLSNNAMDIKFKVVEPNGITLLDNLYKAVVAAYTNPQPTTGAGTTVATTSTATQTTTQPPSYGKAQYCLIIEFYGYDSQGKLVAPATGQNSPTGQLSNTNPQAVIKKYFPFLIQNITFRTAKSGIEYNVVAKPVPYSTNSSQARGTIPFPFSLAGQTVQQILQGSTTKPTGTATADPGTRTPSPTPSSANIPPSQPDDAQTAALFNDGTGFTPGYDPNAGWGGG